MRVLLLLCFAGCAFAIQPTLYYKYHYQGIAETGIPQISTEGAAVGIKLDVILEVTEDGHAVIQFQDIHFAERHNCLGCNLKNAIDDDEFQPIKSHQFKKEMELPFEANLYGKEDYSMLIDTEEILWLTNIRRAIVGLFKNILLKANFDHCTCKLTKHIKESDNMPKIFSQQEETILGKCEVQYTVHKMEGALEADYSYKLEKHTEIDVQRDQDKLAGIKKSKKTSRKHSSKKYSSKKSSKHTKAPSKYSRKGSVPELEDDLYHVTRTVNFDNCEENVALRHSNEAFGFKAGTSTYAWYGSRSSVSEYFFRGSGGALRMESAMVEGAITSRAFGVADERLSAFTNQTLHLKSVEKLRYPTQISPSCEIHGWIQVIMSPFKEPKVSPKVSWVKYMGDDNMVDIMEMLTGIKQTNNEKAARKSLLLQCLKDAARGMAAESPSEEVDPVIVMENIKGVKMILEAMSVNDIKQIVNNILVEENRRPHEIYEKILLVDALVASGSKRAMHIILDLIHTKKLSPLQNLLISATAMNSLYDVSAIPDIADFVINISLKDEPFLASTSLVNFANMVHHYCVVPEASRNHYGGAFFGDEGCNVDHLKATFLPYITNIINDESKTWERIVAIRVLHKLGISSTVDILGPVALGHKGSSDSVRLAAIYALSRWTLPSSTRDHAMQVLSEIYTNIGELPRLRAAALIMYTSWGPEPSFFYRLAKISWTEPSVTIAGLYSSVIQMYANSNPQLFMKQNQAAVHALQLVRPVSPSLKYLLLKRDFKFVLEGYESQIREYGYMKYFYPEPKSNFDAYSFSMDAVNGMHITLTEILVNGGGIGEFVQNSFAQYGTSDIKSKVVEDLYSKIQDVIQASPTSQREPMMTIYLRVFENMNFLLPINQETIKTSQFTDPMYFASILLELQTGLSRSVGKFLTIAAMRECLASEMGLPIYTTDSAYMAFADTFNARLSVSTGGSVTKMPKKSHLFVEEYLKLYSEMVGEMNIIVPWSNSKISTTVRSTRGLSHPIMTSIDLDITPNSKQPQVQIGFEPAYDRTFSVLKAKTIPESRIDPLSFTGKTRTASIMTLVKHDNIAKVIKIPQTYSGMAYTVHWDAQFRFPFDLYGLKNMYQNRAQTAATSGMAHLLSSYTAEYWSLELEFNPQKSETKNITIGFTFHLAGKDKPNEDFSQVSQTSGHYYEQTSGGYDYEQTSGGFDYGQQEFGDYGHKDVQETSISSGKNHGVVNIKDNFQQKTAKMTDHYGDKVNIVAVKLGCYGEKTREYELVYSWSKPKHANMRKSVKSQLTLLRSSIPGIDQKSLSVCIDTQKVTPVLSSFDTLDSVMNRNLDTEITRSITPDCQGDPILVSEATLKMSPERIEKLRYNMKNDCSFDSFDPLNTFYDTVYDQIHGKVKWQDVCDKNRLPILSKVINALDKVLLKKDPFECNVKDASHELDLHLHRCTKTDLWHFKAERDNIAFSVDDVPSNDFIDFFFSLRNVAAGKIDHIKAQKSLSEKCVINHGIVRTFDGVVFDYEPTECWTVATKDCKADRFLVLVRASSTESTVPEVRIIDRENSLVINHIRGEKPDKNGVTEHYSKTSGKLIAKIYKQHNHYSVLLPHKVQVTITDQIQINVLTEEVCGVCGTHDGEQAFEYMGPKHCVYVKPQNFFTSWTGAGETCNLYDSLAKRAEIEKYQQTCQPIYGLFKKSAHYQPLYTEYRWLVKEIGNKYCVTRDSLPQCPQGFFSMNSNHIHVNFQCWHKDRAPQNICSALEQGQDHIYDFVDYQPLTTEVSVVKIDVSCAQNPQ